MTMTTTAKLEKIIAEQKKCPSCEEWFPLSEFQNPAYYCHQSQGMETPEDNDVCRECLREQNEAERYAETGFSQRAYEDHLQDMIDTAADGDDY
jgi:predicted amidophosphoribosyltransferase